MICICVDSFFVYQGVGHVAQLAEQLAYNEKVSGSSPLELNRLCAGVVELVDTPGLGSGGIYALRVQVLPSVHIS